MKHLPKAMRMKPLLMALRKCTPAIRSLIAIGLLFTYMGEALAAPDVFSVKRGHAVIKLANQAHREIDLFSTGNADEIGYIARDADGVETPGVLVGVTGNLTVRTKNGTSHVIIDGLAIKGNLTLVALSNDDRVDIYNSSVGRNLRIVSGPGNDVVNIDNVVVNRDTTLIGQNGNDTHELYSMQIDGRLNLVSGTGDDTIEIATGPAGEFTIGGNALINSGAGSDSTTITDVHFDKPLRLLSGSHDDNNVITHSDLLGSALVNLGSGNDTLTLSESLFSSKKTTYLGTSGVDTLINGPGNLYLSGEPRIVGFENF